ncbi:PF07852 family protein [Streptococcus mitis SK579]|jgi:hypothetical protein|nr:PF07852 family protein [Streptococcus mitis SK579]DAU78540.1 MAG TPA: Protein of unknown function (DUF1642) [Caudoviricetes sp.]
MKKQKLIEKINKIAIETPFPKSKIVDYLEVIKLIEQLDEPQPVKVKQFVADWYEKKKHDLNHYIWDYIYNWNHQEESEFKRWMNCSITSFQTLVNMHQFGYEVEEEKRYFVKAKSIGDHNNYLKYNTNQKHWYFGSRFIYVNDVDTKIHHTRKELEEANFGWVFNCEGIEIEEVEE